MDEVQWSPESESDLIEFWRYLSTTASVDLADRAVGRIVAAGNGLARSPLRGRAREELRPGLRSILSGQHIIFYRVARSVEIVRVLHGRRDLRAIFSKLPED